MYQYTIIHIILSVYTALSGVRGRRRVEGGEMICEGGGMMGVVLKFEEGEMREEG